MPCLHRLALAKYVPGLGVLLCVQPRDLRSASSSFVSTRRSTVTSQTSDIGGQFRRQSAAKSRLSSASDSESVSGSFRTLKPKEHTVSAPSSPLQALTDMEADLSSTASGRQVSCDVSRDMAQLPDFKPTSSFKSKLKSHDCGIFERVQHKSMSSASRNQCSSGVRAQAWADGGGQRTGWVPVGRHVTGHTVPS